MCLQALTDGSVDGSVETHVQGLVLCIVSSRAGPIKAPGGE